MMACLSFLQFYAIQGNNCLNWVVSGEEIWIHPASYQPWTGNSFKWHHLLSKWWPPLSGTQCVAGRLPVTQLMPKSTAPHWSLWQAIRRNIPVFQTMVWFSHMTMTNHTQHRRLGTCGKILVQKHWTVPHSVGIWHPPWRNTCQETSHGWCDRNVCSMRLGWTNLSQAVKSCSTIQGTMLKIVYQ